MQHFKYLSFLIFIALVSGCAKLTPPSQNNDEGATKALYERAFTGNKPDVAMLNLFFTRMPKGGDLHHHYTGSLYVETYLDWVKAKNWFINTCNLQIVKTKEGATCKLDTVDELIADDTLYRKLLITWSDKDFYNHSHEQLPPDSNFFNTFGYFSPVSDEYMNTGLNIIKQRALNENVSYVETMLTRVGIQSAEFFKKDEVKALDDALHEAKSQKEVAALLNKIDAAFAKNPMFNTKIQNYVKEITETHKGIDDANFMMRYQTYAVRVLDPLQVYTDLLSGYLAAIDSPLIVGVNIVAPENNTVSLDDYTLHMQMYHHLKGKYPNVHRALHAGELTLGMVKPKELLSHITQAREIAGAERIGHGVDLPYEKNSLALLEDLKEHASVEINLTSNWFILGVSGNAHPYKIYSSYGVPLVISTDDSGVSRDNLSHEYVLLASRYHPSYETIKKYVYNSIKYSFLSQQDKDTVKARLDKKFAEFEKEMSTFSKRLN